MKDDEGRLRISASDAANFLGCRRATALDCRSARGDLTPPHFYDVGFQKLIERGEAHEERVLRRFQEDGLRVVSVLARGDGSDRERAEATREELAKGVDVVYQGVLLADDLGGISLYGQPDFLVRSDRLPGAQSDTGRYWYEVVDAKLARATKARALLQVVFYSHLLARTTGIEPADAHLALGNGGLATYRVADFAAYERQIRALLGAFVSGGDEPGGSDPYPEPVEHCTVCRWRSTCTTKRRDDDDLSLVAGMRTAQRVALKSAGVTQRRQFAALAEMPRVDGVAPGSLQQAQLQARLQVESEDIGTIRFELLDPDRDADGALVPNRGLLALPEPSPGDLFFDIEGARYYSEDNREFGLQYLFGIVDTADRDVDGRPRYTQIWAFDRQSEKGAFEQLVDFITGRRRENPGLHVYHYNHYEPTSVDHLTALHGTREEAVGRLMGRFGTREDEVDDLFRLGVFVDLYRVVRQGLRVGVESYSIKQLEPLIGFSRQVALDAATENLIAFDAALDAGEAEHGAATRQIVAGYNEDDCRATLALRDWLEARRRDLDGQLDGGELLRPVPPAKGAAPEDADMVRLKAALVEGLPAESEQRHEEDQARALLANLLEWHRREAKPAWWRHFRLLEMSSTELVGEPDAIGGLSGGDIVGQVKRSIVRRFSFPAQEHGFGTGDPAIDPVSAKTWTVVRVDEEEGTIDLKVGKADVPLPTGIIGRKPISTEDLRARVRNLAERVVEGGFAARDPASALLLRQRPDGGGSGCSLRLAGEQASDTLRRMVLKQNGTYLAIQGPPGTGKTFSAAEAIVDLVEQGRSVGLTAPSHAVIHNLLNTVVARAAERGCPLRIGQKPDDAGRFLHCEARSLGYGQLADGLSKGDLEIVAGTAWLWAREEFVGSVDTLFVDEAGQFSLANALAIAGAASNLVLLGDPQQLAQPSQAAHPPGAGDSALTHVLGERGTMPDDDGIFLDRTYRMHPDLCRYTSDVFYDGRLVGVEGLEHQGVNGESWRLPETGLVVVEVGHRRNAGASPEEAVEVVRLVRDLLNAQRTGTDGTSNPITPNDILVVTPFNAQVREIDRGLAGSGIHGVRVGTVDKFQGQEAQVVLYSMASSSVEDAPRGLEFLFDLHRLNVATSRARAVSVIIASPDLLRVFCRTPRQMTLANALCRAREFG